MLLNLNLALLELFFPGTSIAKLVHPRQRLLSQFLGTNKSLISQPVDDLQPADISEYRLQVASEVGIDAVCNVTEESLECAAKRFFGEAGYDMAVEVAGVEDSLDALVAGIGKGGTLVLVGVFGERPSVDMSVVCEHELNLKGSMMYLREDFEKAAQWIASGHIQTEPLISRHFTFEDFSSAYDYLEEQGENALKVIIDVDGKKSKLGSSDS